MRYMKQSLFFLLALSVTCATQIKTNNLDDIFKEIEIIEKLPKDMLKAISIKETGKPWPWTVCVNGKGYYFQNEKEAIAFVKNALKDTDNVDIGCMQINFRHHGKNFRNLTEMFNPENNIRYAAKLLKKLRLISISWQDAIEKYHSFNKEFNQTYRTKVFNIWSTIRANKLKTITKSQKPLRTNKKSLQNHYIDVFYRKIST